ncbi:MAG: carbohydrate-binding domain-containing protein [Clostridia bacterium]|nr:carbohydrate-binding domain-containing protein [Clostridia bacterium]
MKRILSLFVLVLLTISSITSCMQVADTPNGDTNGGTPPFVPNKPIGTVPREPGQMPSSPPTNGQGESDLGDFESGYGEALENSGIYDGYFEGDSTDFKVSLVSGTAGAYKFEGSTLTFTELDEDSVYSVSGTLRGNIVVDVIGDFKLDIELCGFSMVSENINPITVLSGNEISITAKNGSENFIYDKRAAIDTADETLYSAAIYSLVDLEICGKGALSLVSDNNNGIHTKDDLQVKNLTLNVKCKDNALKGNDSVSIESGVTTLIATAGDGIKTTNSNIATSGKQRGTVEILGGTHTVYSACDGIDAAYDAVINGDDVSLSVFTDKYSNYSEEVTVTQDEVYYIRSSKNSYIYSVKLYNSDTDFKWLTPTFDSQVSSGRSTYYYYKFSKDSSYSKIQVIVHESGTATEQETTYLYKTDYFTPSVAYDTIAISQRGSSYSASWTSKSSSMGGGPGGGGMQEGNSDKGTYSTKGIKAANSISILAGRVTVKAYDDAIHANAELTLENGAAPTGNVTVSGGCVTLYSNDDGIHADGTLTISDGEVTVQNSYEGLEGVNVIISGGTVGITSSDDGINSTKTSGAGITLSGGELYIYSGGDGIDSNSTTSKGAIVFSGSDVVVISTSGGNSAIDSDGGYSFTGGRVLAVMPTGAMTSEAKNCSNFSSVGKEVSLSLTADNYLTVSGAVTVKIPKTMSSVIIYLGSSTASISTAQTASASLNVSGVKWE